MSDAPERIWLDRDFQPWRVWTIGMTDLPEYVPAARIAALEAQLAAAEARLAEVTGEAIRTP